MYGIYVLYSEVMFIWAALCVNVSFGLFRSEGPDQPEHQRSLSMAFTVRKQNHWIPRNISMESKGPDDFAHMQADMHMHN